MNLKLQKTIYMLSRYFLYVLLLQTVFINLALAVDVHAQYKRIDEVLVRLDRKDLTLEQFFRQIEEKSDFQFSYDKQDIDRDFPVNLHQKTASVEDYLKQVALQASLAFRQVNNSIDIKKTTKPVVVQPSVADVTITGRVTDVSGEPIPGVTVSVPGTGIGTATDMDGKYSLSVPEGSTLVFSFIGFETQRIEVADQSVVDITLHEDLTSLDEVVVVGYGTQKKVNVTGAVSTVSAEELEDRPVTSVAQALMGLVPNLVINTTDGGRPGSPFSWNIRGQGSIGGITDDSPLILVDGIPGDPNALNPDDIENISVLKDAAASAIYGSRAPFGVVLITTKKGQSGQMKVSYHSNFTMQTPTNRLYPMGSLDFVNYANASAANVGVAPYFPQFYVDSLVYNIENPHDYKPVMIDPSNPDNWNFGGVIAVDTDWWREVYKDRTFMQNHNLTLSGGSEKVRYYSSLGYLDQDGLFNHGDDKYKRYTGLLNLNVEATKWLDLSLRMQVSRRDEDSPNSPGLRNTFRRWPIYPVYDANGNWFNYASEVHLAAEGGREITVNDAFNNTVGFVIKPFKDFRLNGDLTYNSHDERFTRNNKVLYHYNVLGEIAGTQPDANQSYIEKTYNMNKYYSTNIYGDYSRQFGAHNLNLLAGYQQEYNHFYQLLGYRNDLISEDVLSLNTATGTDIRTNDGEYEWSTRGYFGRISYNFDEKYLFEVNARYDGSSRFPSDVRWGFFPSVSAGYNIAQEAFFEPLSNAISMLKFRASYGRLGNSNVYSYYYSPSMGKNQSDYIGPDGTFLDFVGAPGFGNYGITWEKPTTFNVGLDLAVLNNQLQITADWFQRTTTDMIGPSEPLPLVLGQNVPQTNNTKLKGTGWEVSLAYRGRVNEFNYHANFNIARNRQEVLEYYNPTGLYRVPYKGSILGDIWGLETVGIISDEETLNSMPSQSEISGSWGLGDIQYKDQDGDGRISRGSLTVDDPGDFKIIGNTTPDFVYNFSFGGDFKGFDFRAFFYGFGPHRLVANGWPGRRHHDYQDFLWKLKQPLESCNTCRAFGLLDT